jgi:hypothetical protein
MCPGGLRGLAALLLNKNGRITTRQKKMTNWEKHHLTFPERSYAATDAWIALELFTVVNKSKTCRLSPKIIVSRLCRPGRDKRRRRNESTRNQRKTMITADFQWKGKAIVVFLLAVCDTATNNA